MGERLNYDEFVVKKLYMRRTDTYTGCNRRNGPEFGGGGVPYVKLYRKTPKHLYPKLNGFGDNGQ